MTALQACTLQSVPRQLLIHLLMYMIFYIYYFQIHLLLNFEKYISKVPARTWGVPASRSGMEEQSSSDFFTIISPGGDYLLDFISVRTIKGRSIERHEVENRSGPSYTRHTQKSQWVEIFLYRLNKATVAHHQQLQVR